MSQHRPYKVTLRYLGSQRNYCERTLTYATRERAFEQARTRLAERNADRQRVETAAGRPFDPARYDATVFGPDADLRTGRIVKHDGTEVDLMDDLARGAERARQYLLAQGWSDAEIEAGRRDR